MTSISEHAAQEANKISNIECPIARSIALKVRDRAKVGLKTYGQTCADNDKTLIEWLQDAIEESLDKAIYMERAIAEIKNLGIINSD